MAKKVTRSITTHTVEAKAINNNTEEQFVVTEVFADTKNFEKAFKKFFEAKYPDCTLFKFSIVSTDESIWGCTEEEFMLVAKKIKKIKPIEE